MSDIQLTRENERLRLYNDDLRVQMNNKDIKHQEEVQKLKKEYEDEIKSLGNKINLQVKKRQISDEEIKNIKELRASGLTYSKIKKETGWSNVTINRVLNGIYD